MRREIDWEKKANTFSAKHAGGEFKKALGKLLRTERMFKNLWKIMIRGIIPLNIKCDLHDTFNAHCEKCLHYFRKELER